MVLRSLPAIFTGLAVFALSAAMEAHASSRLMEGNCASVELGGAAAMQPEAAVAALAAIERRGIDPFGADLANVLVSDYVMDIRAAQAYVDSMRERMVVSAKLYAFLTAYNRTVEPARWSVVELWSMFENQKNKNSNHIDDSCHGMVVWYRTFFGGLNGNPDELAFLFASVILLDDHFVRLVKEDLQMRASLTTTNSTTRRKRTALDLVATEKSKKRMILENDDLYSPRLWRYQEIASARRIMMSEGPACDFNSIRDQVASELHRPARYLSDEELALFRSEKCPIVPEFKPWEFLQSLRLNARTYVDAFYQELGAFAADQLMIQSKTGQRRAFSNVEIQNAVSGILGRPAETAVLSSQVIASMRDVGHDKVTKVFAPLAGLYARFLPTCMYRVKLSEVAVAVPSTLRALRRSPSAIDVGFYYTMVEVIRNHDFSQQPLTLAALREHLPGMTHVLEYIWNRLHKALFLDPETYFQLVEMNQRDGGVFTTSIPLRDGQTLYQVSEWYKTVFGANVGKSIAEIGVSLTNHHEKTHLVVPPPGLILSLAEADLAAFTQL